MPLWYIKVGNIPARWSNVPCLFLLVALLQGSGSPTSRGNHPGGIFCGGTFFYVVKSSKAILGETWSHQPWQFEPLIFNQAMSQKASHKWHQAKHGQCPKVGKINVEWSRPIPNGTRKRLKMPWTWGYHETRWSSLMFSPFCEIESDSSVCCESQGRCGPKRLRLREWK